MSDIDPYYKLKGLAKLVFSHITMWVIGTINMLGKVALLVFNRSKIVFTTFLSIQILEQFYHIHKLCYTLFPDFLFYFAFSPQAHYTTFQKDTYQVLFLRKTI